MFWSSVGSSGFAVFSLCGISKSSVPLEKSSVSCCCLSIPDVSSLVLYFLFSFLLVLDLLRAHTCRLESLVISASFVSDSSVVLVVSFSLIMFQYFLGLLLPNSHDIFEGPNFVLLFFFFLFTLIQPFLSSILLPFVSQISSSSVSVHSFWKGCSIINALLAVPGVCS